MNENAPTHKSSHKVKTHTPVSGYHIEDLRTYPTEKLLEIANKLKVENPQEFKRQDLMFEILKPKLRKADTFFLPGF